MTELELIQLANQSAQSLALVWMARELIELRKLLDTKVDKILVKK